MLSDTTLKMLDGERIGMDLPNPPWLQEILDSIESSCGAECRQVAELWVKTLPPARPQQLPQDAEEDPNYGWVSSFFYKPSLNFMEAALDREDLG